MAVHTEYDVVAVLRVKNQNNKNEAIVFFKEFFDFAIIPQEGMLVEFGEVVGIVSENYSEYNHPYKKIKIFLDSYCWSQKDQLEKCGWKKM